MLFPFKSRKKDSEKHLEPTISPIFDESLDEPLPMTEEQEFSLKDFAVKHGISEGQVWRKIKRGELIGRPLNGDLVIASPMRSDAKLRPQNTLDNSARTSKKKRQEKWLEKEALARSEPAWPSKASTLRPAMERASLDDTDQAPPALSVPDAKRSGGKGSSQVVMGGPVLAKKSTLPPVPPSYGAAVDRKTSETSDETPSHWPLSSGAGAGAPVSSSTELALLIDHLSLSKDENREILRLAQESIRKITELSDTLVAMKDAVIEAKTTQIESLKELLALRDKEIKTLQKSNEDLEILARTVSRQAILERDT